MSTKFSLLLMFLRFKLASGDEVIIQTSLVTTITTTLQYTELEFDLFIQFIHATDQAIQLLCSCTNQLLFLFLSLSTFLESLAHKPVTVHLVHETDIDYQCPICYELFTEPFAEPFITDCGHLCCRKCRDRLLDSGKTECPTCREPNMLNDARSEKYLQRVVKSLKVRCSDYKEGCEWVGELRDLHDHLDPAKGRCGIACPFDCSKYGRRIEMKEHSRHCHKRMISCENCGYYNTFTIVTEKHYPICPQSPIDCPNQHCPVEGLRRHQLEQHLNECSHQLVDCPNTGCSVRLPRGEMKLHTLQQHNLVLEETNPSFLLQYHHNTCTTKHQWSSSSAITVRRKKLMKSGTVHHFIPTTEATSSVSMCTPMVTMTAVVLTFQYMLNL